MDENNQDIRGSTPGDIQICSVSHFRKCMGFFLLGGHSFVIQILSYFFANVKQTNKPKVSQIFYPKRENSEFGLILKKISHPMSSSFHFSFFNYLVKVTKNEKNQLS